MRPSFKHLLPKKHYYWLMAIGYMQHKTLKQHALTLALAEGVSKSVPLSKTTHKLRFNSPLWFLQNIPETSKNVMHYKLLQVQQKMKWIKHPYSTLRNTLPTTGAKYSQRHAPWCRINIWFFTIPAPKPCYMEIKFHGYHDHRHTLLKRPGTVTNGLGCQSWDRT